MHKKLILMGLAVLVLIMVAWYCMPAKTSKSRIMSENPTAGNETTNIPETFEDLTRLSKYKKPILGSVDNFLTSQECNEIIEIGKMIVKPSTTGFGSTIKAHPSRTSQSGWVKHNATAGLTRLTQYISSILKVPPNHFEPYQIVHYGPDQFYKYHLDSCNPDSDDYTECVKNLKKFGGRKYTVLIYLNNNYLGGETHFKHIDTLVKGTPGSIVFFNNMKEGSNESDPLSLHAGTTVTAGEKWLINVWVRDKANTDDYSESVFPSETLIKEINARKEKTLTQEAAAEQHNTDILNGDALPSKEPPTESI